MLVKVLKTYRGKHGLFIQGHPYNLTKGQIASIESECEEQKTKFEYEPVKDPRQINRPARKQQTSPSDKQQKAEKTK